MGAENEAVVREFFAAMEGEQWDAAHLDRMLSKLAPNARYHTYAWEEPHVGHDAIRAEWTRQASLFRDCQEEIVTIGSFGSTVFTERLDVITIPINDTRVALHIASVFEMNSDCKITLWRDYGDREEVAVALRQKAASESPTDNAP